MAKTSRIKWRAQFTRVPARNKMELDRNPFETRIVMKNYTCTYVVHVERVPRSATTRLRLYDFYNFTSVYT